MGCRERPGARKQNEVHHRNLTAESAILSLEKLRIFALNRQEVSDIAMYSLNIHIFAHRKVGDS
jgi:hypothetical protein